MLVVPPRARSTEHEAGSSDAWPSGYPFCLSSFVPASCFVLRAPCCERSEPEIQNLATGQSPKSQRAAADGEEILQAEGADQLAAGDGDTVPGRLLPHALEDVVQGDAVRI